MLDDREECFAKGRLGRIGHRRHAYAAFNVDDEASVADPRIPSAFSAGDTPA